MPIGRWTYPFWNDDERRIRALLRVLAIMVAVVTAQMIVAVAFAGQPLGWVLVAALVGAEMLAPLAVVAIGARLLDRRPLSSYGLRLNGRWWREFGFGATLGLAMYAAAFLAIVVAGWGRVDAVLSPGPDGLWSVLGVAAVSWLTNAFFEELLVRGRRRQELRGGPRRPVLPHGGGDDCPCHQHRGVRSAARADLPGR